MLRVRSLASTLIPSFLAIATCGALVACGTTDGNSMDTDSTWGDSTTASGTSTSTASNAGSSTSSGASSSNGVNPTSATSSSHTRSSTATASSSTSHTTTSAPTSETDDTQTAQTSSDSEGNTSGQVGAGSDSDTTSDATSSNATSSSTTSDTTDDTTEPPGDGAGFYTRDGKLYDVNDVEFIMRGVNYPYAWYKDSQNTEQMFADIATTGSNVVRVVLSSGDHPEGWQRNSGSEVTNIINWAKTNKLVAMLEVHDATGYGDADAGVHPNAALDYWTSNDISTAIKGQEAYVLLNIANESFGNDKSQEWEEFYEAAVGELRAAGLHHTLIVDAPMWGQDWGNCMRDGNTTNPRQMTCKSDLIFTADPDANTVFSVHMYDVYGMASAVTDYFDKFLMHGVPFIVGEFAADHGSSGNVDEATIMRLSEERKVGYIGWSWSGNSGSLSSLDITNNFNLGSLTTWGDTLINGANGLKETGVPCTCFD